VYGGTVQPLFYNARSSWPVSFCCRNFAHFFADCLHVYPAAAEPEAEVCDDSALIFLATYLSFIDLVIPVQLIRLKISPKILFTVFANASPSLLTYPISPAYCIPLLISVLWSLICLVK
jgi:hypothetical protein